MGKQNSDPFWSESPDTNSNPSGMSDFELYGPDGVDDEINWQVAKPELADEGPNEPLPDGSADVAQLVEQSLRKRKVAGSIPAIGSMSRLESKQTSSFHTLLAVFIIFCLCIVAVLMFVGIAPIINFAAGISSMFGSRTSAVSASATNSVISLRPDDLPVATSTATLKVSGNVSNAASVAVYIGGTRKKTIDTARQSQFDGTISLTKGRNEIQFVALNDAGRRESDVHVVFYLSEKPTITLETPSSESLTTLENYLNIKGAVEPKSVTLTVNSTPVVVDADGVFQYSASLNQGDNTITVKAVDEAGQETVKTLQVKREK